MSTRPQIKTTPVFTPATGQSMAANLTGLVSIISNITLIGYGFSWSGASPVGTITIECSNDYSIDAMGNVYNGGTWNTVPFDLNGTTVTSLPVSGNTGNGFVDIDALSAYAIRPVYTPASGNGTLSATITGKVA